MKKKFTMALFLLFSLGIMFTGCDSDSTDDSNSEQKLGPYTVSFDANGGSGSMDSVTVEAGEVILLKTCSFSNGAKLFTGWNTISTGHGSFYADKATIIPAANTTLYAQWAEPCKVTFKPNGATGSEYTQSVPYGIETALTKTTFTNEGSVFASWNTSEDGTGDSYRDGSSVTLNDDLTLYAIWRTPQTVTFKANGGTGDDYTQTVAQGEPTPLSENKFEKTDGSLPAGTQKATEAALLMMTKQA